MKSELEVVKQIDFLSDLVSERRKYLEVQVNCVSPEHSANVLSAISAYESQVQILRWVLQ